MNIKREITIEKPISEVWEVLANQFGEIDKWASIISKSEVSGPAIDGTDYSIRTTMTAKGETKQQLTSFEPDKHSISYKSISGTPPIVKQVFAEWTLNKKGENSTALSLDFKANLNVIGAILSPIVKVKFGKVGDILLDDLTHYIENGKPSSNKMKSMQSN